ncbi:MAG TPA: class I SAM-dependent methyltransferase [Anaerolineales bacterium]|nr:class I SAM-dependent methyltransferase [Anaerolineales bacterium]
MNNDPEGDHIYDLFNGAYKPHIIRIALELDVFSKLERTPAKAAAIANECHCDITGMSRLLDYLISLGLLLKKDDEYNLSCDAATFLVYGKKSYAGNLIMDFSGCDPWNSVLDSIRSGVPRNIDLEIHFAQDAWIESYRSKRIHSSLEMWTKAGVIPSETLKLKVLDIASGCGIKSMVLVRQSENVVLTCLDSPLVLEVGRDLATRWGISSRVQFLSDDLFTADLGEREYDCCLLGQITHYLTQQQNLDLFIRIYKALLPGGRLLLDVPMATTRLDEESSFLSLLLWVNSGGCAYSFFEYQNYLTTAGFTSVIQLSERLLLSVKQ